MRLAPINQADPVNWSHPLNQGLLSWHRPMSLSGGPVLYDLCGRAHASLTGFGSGYGFVASTMAGRDQDIAFNASNNYMQSPGTMYWFVAGQPFSAMCWVAMGNVGVYSDIVNNQNASLSYRGWNLSNSLTGMFRVQIFGSSGSLDVQHSGASMQANTWYHLAFTYNGNQDVSGLTLYINGTSQSKTTFTNTLAGDMDSAVDLYVGKRAAAGTSFAGRVGEVLIHNRAISASEVLGLYNESLAGYPTMLNRLDSPIARFAPQGGPFPWFLDQSAMSGGLQTMGF